MRDYPKLGIVDFGRVLLGSRDLDPAYVAFAAPGVIAPAPGCLDPFPAQARWLLSYWCFYDVGLACHMSELEGTAEFWGTMTAAARNETPCPTGGRWPRGRERRHFRGAKCLDAVGRLEVASERPHRLVDRLRADRAADVMKVAQELPMFGPWIAFKVADMLEACLGWPIDFSAAEVFMFDTPREAALLVWRDRMRMAPFAKPLDEAMVLREVVKWLLDQFPGELAPPRFDRPLGLQEAETILCKWKSHLGGHYPLNHDTDEFRRGLEPWAKVCATAARFRAALPGAAA